jgi:hypothetical protein
MPPRSDRRRVNPLDVVAFEAVTLYGSRRAHCIMARARPIAQRTGRIDTCNFNLRAEGDLLLANRVESIDTYKHIRIKDLWKSMFASVMR